MNKFILLLLCCYGCNYNYTKPDLKAEITEFKHYYSGGGALYTTGIIKNHSSEEIAVTLEVIIKNGSEFVQSSNIAISDIEPHSEKSWNSWTCKCKGDSVDIKISKVSKWNY